MSKTATAAAQAAGKQKELSIDEHAQIYLAIKGALDAAKATLDEKKDELVKLARKKGTIPAGAEKSLRLEGERYIITASFGTSSSIDDTVVAQIREELDDAHTPRLFNRLFAEETTYVVAPTAPGCLENVSKKVRELFAQVMKTKPKEPSLKVEERKKKSAKRAR